jgi:diguanylate cyclase (GGDEF)-like protein
MSLQDLQPYIAFLGTITQLAVAVLLSLLFLLLRRYAERRKYFLTWAKSWLALSVAIAAVVVRYYILPGISTPVLDDWRPEVRLLYSIYQGAKLVFYALLAAGTALYVRGAVQARMRQLVAVGIVVYTAISALYARDLNQFVMLQAPPAVMLTGWCGTMIYTMPRSRRTLGSLTLGGVFWYMAIVWSIYFVAFGLAGPLLPEYPGPAWFGFIVRYNPYFDLMAQVALGYAMVVLVMEDAKREVDNAHGELAVAHDQLRRASLYDSVTGSMNRRAFQEGLGLDAARATFGAVMMLDVDNLKTVNDQHGHAAGDALLRYLVEVLRAELRGSDKLYRWGGDEFLLVFPGSTATLVKRRLENVVAAADPLALGPEGHPVRLAASFGASDYASAEELRGAIEYADADMYREKSHRKSLRAS